MIDAQGLTNKPAPDFSLPDRNSKLHKLSDYQGKWVVVYFYPKDDTPGCTKEACGFRDIFAEYSGKGIEVLGISKDSPASHKKFIEKYKLKFTLLSDEEKKVIKSYGAWGKKKFMGREFEGVFRYSFLIDPKGIIRKVYTTVKPDEHAKQILEDMINLR